MADTTRRRKIKSLREQQLEEQAAAILSGNQPPRDTSGVAPQIPENQKSKPTLANEAEISGPDDWMDPYLEALAETGQYTKAAETAGVRMIRVVHTRRYRPAFAEREHQAMAVATSVFVSELTRRAVEGTEELRYGKDGKITTQVRRFSDGLLLRLLEYQETKSWKPSQQIEHTANPLQHQTRADRKQAIARAKQQMLENAALDQARPIYGKETTADAK